MIPERPCRLMKLKWSMQADVRMSDSMNILFRKELDLHFVFAGLSDLRTIVLLSLFKKAFRLVYIACCTSSVL